MEVSFYLKRPKSKVETVIFARIFYGMSEPLKYYLPERINPVHWNKDTQRARESKKFREYPEFNTRLDKIEAKIKTTVRKYENDNDTLPDHHTLRLLLDETIKHKTTHIKKHTLLSYFDEIIELSKVGIRKHPKTHAKLSVGTIRSYVIIKNRLLLYEKFRGKAIEFEEVGADFYNNIITYLTTIQKLKQNTIGKTISTIKLIMNEALATGITTNTKHKARRFMSITENVDNIYLDDNEIAAMAALDLSSEPKLQRVRDLFLIGCYTGLRFSDFSALTEKNLVGGFFEVKQIKTGNNVIIPLHPEIEKIQLRNGDWLPKSISNQKFNEYIKNVAKRIDALQAITQIEYTKGGQRIKENFQRWELVSSHTARRSFSTNEYNAGTPPLTIMAITGHRTEAAFLKYIKVTPKEHAKKLNQMWKERMQTTEAKRNEGTSS